MIVVLAPDSFKGSLSAVDVCASWARGLRRVWPEVDLRFCPMADGGEGTLDVLLAATGGERRRLTVTGASGDARDAEWGMFRHPASGASVGLIEVAQAVPLTDAAGTRLPIERRSSAGVGELVRAALDTGIRHLAIGLGGSSTNDGGAGLLAALGARWLDEHGAPLEPVPFALRDARTLDLSLLDPRLAESSIEILSDVTNPLCGPFGATHVFGPQKGLLPERVDALEAALAHLGAIAEAAFGRRACDFSGSGAAGGLGFALRLLGGTMCSGASTVAELNGLAIALQDADWMITGEGRTDSQTLGGKAPAIAARMAQEARVPVTLISGSVDRTSLTELNTLFDRGCFSPCLGPETLDNAMVNAAQWLADTADQVARIFASNSAVAVSLPPGSSSRSA